MTPAEEDEFCQIANGRLNYQSNTDQTREIRAWVKRRPEVRTLISNAVAIFARRKKFLVPMRGQARDIRCR